MIIKNQTEYRPQQLVHVQSAGNMIYLSVSQSMKQSDDNQIYVKQENNSSSQTLLKKEFNKLDVNKTSTVPYKEAQQLLTKLTQQESILPFQTTYNLQQLETLLMSRQHCRYTPIPQSFGQVVHYHQHNVTVAELDDELSALFKCRIQMHFGFNALKCAQMQINTPNHDIYCNSDIFEYIHYCYATKLDIPHTPYLFNPKITYKPLIGIDIQFNRSSEVMKLFNRTTYRSDWRSEAIKKCGWSEPNQFRGIYNNQPTEYYGRLRNNKLQSRLAAVACCHFDFQEAISALSLTHNNLVPVLRAMNNLGTVISMDIDDRNRLFLSNPNIPPQYSNINKQDLENYIHTKALVSLEFAPTPYSNINDNHLKDAIIKSNLDYLTLQFKGAEFDDPYLQLIANFFSMDDIEFKKYIKNNNQLSFYDHFSICLLFLDDAALKDYLNNTKRFDYLILKGSGNAGVQLLQEYLDNTNDIQLAGVVAAHFYLLGYPQKDTLALMYNDYRRTLNAKQMYTERFKLEQELHEMEKKIYKQEVNELSIFGYLDKKLNRTTNITYQCNKCSQYVTGSKCPTCSVASPQCNVCKAAIVMQKNHTQFIQCQECKHGGHAKHIIAWFQEYKECPTQYCDCECNLNI